MTVSVIVAGVLYVEKSMKSTVVEVMAPYVKDAGDMKKTVEFHSIELNSLKTKSDLNEYKWNIYENQIKNFLKPEDIELKNRHRK